MFLKIGHRGARAYETENTIESFRKAIELGVNAIECDVRRTKDGKPVICHDDDLKRVFGHDARVDESTLKGLKKLTGNKIPSLGEALRFIDGKVEKILIELKETGYEKKVVDVIKKEKLKDRVIIVSFHEEALAAIRSHNTEIETGIIFSKPRNPVAAALRLRAQYLLPLYKLVRTGDVEKAHEKDLKVIVWTINTSEEAKAYIVKGVDGIASDRPDIFKGVSQPFTFHRRCRS
ncbi:MAG: glycerophosphodiester phosphodiesterase [bacterium]